jgi:hypothetical protein
MSDSSDFRSGGFVKAGDNLRYVESTIVPVAVTLDVSARISSAPAGIFVGDSGTKMYIADDTNNRIDQYTLSTANSLVGATYASKTHSDANLSGKGLFFRPDGTKVYYLTLSEVKEVALSTPWDISTGGATATLNISSNVTASNGLSFSSDGTKVYVLDTNGPYIEQYTLSTPWNVSSGSFASKRLYARYFDGNAIGILFNTTGTEVTVLSEMSGVPSVTYSLSVAWDVSTGTFLRAGMEGRTNARGFCWSSTGAKLFTIAADQTAREHTLNTAYVASQQVTIFSYSGKATLLGLAVKPSPEAASSSWDRIQNSVVYCNVDSAGSRLIGNSTFNFLASNALSLSEPKIFTGCIAKSKTSLIVTAEAREHQIIEARYSIG